MNVILWRLTWIENLSPYALCDFSDTVGAIAFESQSSVVSNRYKAGKGKLKNKNK